MNLTIIPSDSLVTKDGRGLVLDLAQFDLPPTIHAIQWYGSWGEIEIQGRPNAKIVSVAKYQPIIDAFDARAYEIDNPPPPTLDEAKSIKASEINQWKEAQRQHFDWSGHRWDSDPNGRDNIMGVVIAGIAPPSGYWTSADNVDVPITTVAEMQAMYQAMVGRASAIHDRQRAMKLEVEAMTDVEAVLGYLVGWG